MAALANSVRRGQSHGVVNKRKSKDLFAYTDETGNTGLKIFDEAQPYFHTLTLVGRRDLNKAVAPWVSRWCATLGVDELHASELGVGRLERVAPSMLEFLMSERPLFIFTTVEKRHLSVMKFADTVLDCPAVTGFHYGHRAWRLRMCLSIAQHFTPDSEREFWDAFNRKDYELFVKVAARVESSLMAGSKDLRERELVGDPLRWAMKHPEDLLVRAGHLDSPNIVAFGFVIHALHAILLNTGLRVKTFIHDEQNQFMGAFHRMYEMLHKFRAEEQVDTPFTEWKQADTFNCPLTKATSKGTPALQLVDTLLWLLKRFVSKGTTGGTACDALLAPIFAVGFGQEFSRQQLEDEVAEALKVIPEMMSALKDPALLQMARALGDMLEEGRQRSMREHGKSSE
jgi:hypothetical protein